MHIQANEALTINLPNGTSVLLLPERAMFLATTRTLYITDTHFGKAAFFRSFGIAVPQNFLQPALQRLDSLLQKTKAARLRILGDLFHAEEGCSPDVLAALAAWRNKHPKLDIINVRGNHDHHTGDPPGYLNIHCVDSPFNDGTFTLAHKPFAKPDAYLLAGHIHPAARLIGAGKQVVKLPCFWFTETTGVLPAFTEFSSGAAIKAKAGDAVYVIADSQVVTVS